MLERGYYGQNPDNGRSCYFEESTRAFSFKPVLIARFLRFQGYAPLFLGSFILLRRFQGCAS